MITLAEFEECGITVSDMLTGNAALEYIARNTTLTVDLEKADTVKALPFSAKLFVQKYEEVTSTPSAVASESIESLSQSFKTGDKKAMIDDLANTYLDEWLIGKVRFVSATRRWKYGR